MFGQTPFLFLCPPYMWILSLGTFSFSSFRCGEEGKMWMCEGGVDTKLREEVDGEGDGEGGSREAACFWRDRDGE